MAIGDRIENAAEKVAGKVKEGVGKLTDDERLKTEGKTDQGKAEVKDFGEDVKDRAAGVADSFSDNDKK
ncbi:CsbD family protein [Naumannella halotolerans]|uniref:Uncharacterized protein YjbJ (UPF0337 family) n=1 Tax=Naumannella halotolerans TaxID=993414 RepID=A0A4R7J9N8_9ACTN|nr:CsbD family protein [Naumannella halotolerans]TDT34251.1 uncharacterized protein YjbJ (UPF0337 family) [Naumannella halotolerans]